MSREAWDAAVVGVEHEILRQVVEGLEVARIFRRRSVTEIAKRAHISLRMVRYVRALKARPSLRTLIALCEAHGLELDIRVRAKRGRVQETKTTERQASVVNAGSQENDAHGETG